MACQEVIVSLDVTLASLLVLKTRSIFHIDCSLLIVYHKKVVVTLVLQMKSLKLTCYLYTSTYYHWFFPLTFCITKVMNFTDCRQRYSILNTLLNAPNRSLKVYLTEGVLTPMNTVNPWKQLKLVRYISFHLWLLPHIHPTKPNQLPIFHSRIFPKLCKIVTILTSRVNHLHYPQLIRIP